MRAQDLAAFRTALRLQNGLVPAEDRRQEPRYTPVGPLARAKVVLSASAGPIDADVVDLSLNGLRLAVPPDALPETGLSCGIQLTPDGRRILQLQGEIRWVERHPLITVFGVLLESDTSMQQLF
jgi:hypothetical protein